jgi:hypothetical protein
VRKSGERTDNKRDGWIHEIEEDERRRNGTVRVVRGSGDLGEHLKRRSRRTLC